MIAHLTSRLGRALRNEMNAFAPIARLAAVAGFFCKLVIFTEAADGQELDVRELRIRFVEPLMETPVAVLPGELLKNPLVEPVCESRFTDPGVLDIAGKILKEAKIDKATPVTKELTRNNIDARIVFEFISKDGSSRFLGFRYPDLLVWLNVDGKRVQSERVPELLSLLPEYMVRNIRDAERQLKK